MTGTTVRVSPPSTGASSGRRATRRGFDVSAGLWAGMFTASALPLIAYTELSGDRAPLWLPAVQVAVLVALMLLAPRVPRLRPLADVLRWLVAMAAGWHLVAGLVTATDAWQDWQHSVPWVVRGAAFQALLCVPTALLVLLGPGRVGRRALRLRLGDDACPATPGIYTAGRLTTWRRLGPAWAVLITAGTTTAMAFALGPQLGDVRVLLWSMPVIAVLAATNTFNEEFGYRNVPLTLLPGLIGRRQTLLLTGLMFGLAHYYGNPPAASGVLLATFLGVLLAKSMLETDGSKWTWIIHWLQDVVIFSFLTLAWASL